jgi:hypothetical protein
MMWYSNRLFRLEELVPQGSGEGDIWNEDIMLHETREMLLIAYLLESTEVDGRTALSLWRKISHTIDVFTGPAEDLDVPAVLRLSREIWGKVLWILEKTSYCSSFPRQRKTQTRE